MLFAELSYAVDTTVQHGVDQLAVHELHDTIDAAGASDRQTVHERSPNGDGIRAQRQRFDDVGASAYAAIHDDRDIALQGLRNLGQDRDGRRRAVQGPAAVIGYLYRGCAGLDRRECVFGAGDAFDDDRQACYRADELQVLPGKIGLERVGIARREVAIGQPRARLAKTKVLIRRTLADG